MAIAALSTAAFSQYVALTSNVGASQQAWQSLQQSVAAGNLTAAQTAFNTYQKLSQNTSGSGSTSSANSRLSTDMTALGKAIGSGDVTTAQQALATVQSDLKNTPSQAIASAESAVAQTVSWVDDLLNFGRSNNSSTSSVDPVTAIFESIYGLGSSSNTSDPTLALLESKYGAGASSGAAASGSTAGGSASPGAGNSGSGASVNVYA
jgi:ribosomal protein S20